MGGRARPKWEAVRGRSGRPCEAEVGGRSERLKWEAEVRGRGGRPREAKVGGLARPNWEAVGGQSGRPWEAEVGC